MPTTRRALLLLVSYLACQAGCGGPSRHEILVKDGRLAEKRQAWLEAARLYGEACTLDPKDAKTCKRAQEMRDYGIEIRTYRARQLCQSGQLAACVEEFRPLLAVRSNKQPMVQAIVEEAGALAMSQCRASGAALTETLSELACLQHWQESLWRSEKYRAHFATRSRGVAGQVTVLADSQGPGNVGARMSLLDAASCVAPINSQQRSNLQVSASAFTRLLATPLSLKYTTGDTTRPAHGTCSSIAEATGRGLTCDASAKGKASEPLEALAEIFGTQPRWQKSRRDTEHVATYKAGTEQVANPNYDRVRLEYELAESRFADTERDMREQERRCNDTESEADCDSFDSLRREADDRRRERDRARSRFNQESPTITRDVFRDHHYVTRHHEWVSPFRASVKLTGRDWAPEVTDIVYRDTEQKGFAPAGVQADPFEPPSQTYFRDQSGRWLTSRLQEHIAAEMTRRAQALVDSCQGEPIECWSRAQYWGGGTEFGLPLLRLLATRGANEEKAVKHELRCTANLL